MSRFSIFEMNHRYNARSSVSLILLIVLILNYSNALNNSVAKIDMNIDVAPPHRKTRFERNADYDADDHVSLIRDPGPLVKYGKFCKELPIDIYGNGIPEEEPPPVTYKIYFLDANTPNTLHIVFKSKEKSFTFDFLVVMAINEDGVPIGHFHLMVCRRGAKTTGIWRFRHRCNKGKDPTRAIKRKWGNPHIVYVEHDEHTFRQKINLQSIFWSWIPRDRGPRPNFVQFRFAIVQFQAEGKDKIWIGTTTPTIQFRNVWTFIPPKASEGEADLDNPLADDQDDPEECYANPVQSDSPGNFLLTSDTVVRPVNEEYLSLLFPLWFQLHKIPEKYKRVLLARLTKEQDQLRREKDLQRELNNFMRPPSKKLSMKRTKDYAKEIYNGCSRIKSCLGENEFCVGRKNCKFIVTYQNLMYQNRNKKYIRLEVAAKLPKGKNYGYAAVGVSRDQFMGDDNVIECSVDEGNINGVFNSWNFNNKTNRRMSKSCTNGRDRGNIKDCKIAIKGNVLICTFYLAKFLHLPELPLQDMDNVAKGFDLERESFYLLRALGNQFLADTRSIVRMHKPGRSQKRKRRDAINRKVDPKALRKIGKHIEKYSSTRPLDLTRIIKVAVPTAKEMVKEVDENDELKYLRWHVAFVVLAFIGLVPNGIFVARYFKETWTAAMIFNTTIWRVAHTAYMLSVVFLLFVDLTVMFLGNSYWVNNAMHSAFGCAIYFVLILIQPYLGFTLSYLKFESKFQFSLKIIHWAIGTLMKIFANLVIALAPIMIQTRLFIGIWVIVLLELIFNILMHLIMTLLYHKGDMKLFKDRRHSHGRWNRAFNPLPMAKLHRAMPGERRRLLLYLWYQFGTAVFASLIIIPYAGYNNLFVCKDDPLVLTKVVCTNKGL